MKKLFVFSLLLLAGKSYGATITWANNMFPTTVDASGNGVDLGVTTKSILDDTNTFSLIATSLNITNLPASGTSVTPVFGTPVDLGWKNQGAPTLEHGLGVMSAPDAEIRTTYALRLSLSGISFTTFTIVIDSIDNTAAGNEGYRIWGSTTATGPMTLLASGQGSSGFVQTQTFGNTYSFFEVTSDSPTNGVSSMIVRSVTANTAGVPEPATLAMMGFGLLAVGYMRIRKRG